MERCPSKDFHPIFEVQELKKVLFPRIYTLRWKIIQALGLVTVKRYNRAFFANCCGVL